jgi:hypothetical protein
MTRFELIGMANYSLVMMKMTRIVVSAKVMVNKNK